MSSLVSADAHVRNLDASAADLQVPADHKEVAGAMCSTSGTVLKAVLRQRHLQTHGAFCRAYDKAAAKVDRSLIGYAPRKAQFYRWLAGEIKGLPYPDHCRVLEAMLPGYTAEQLFSPAPAFLPTVVTEIASDRDRGQWASGGGGASAASTAARPPRLTFAGVCLWCGHRECESPECVRLHKISRWVVCSGCHGSGESIPASDGRRGCDCAYGLALVAPAVQRSRRLAGGIVITDRGHWSSGRHQAAEAEQRQHATAYVPTADIGVAADTAREVA